jgi:hypothetical protein
VQSLEAYNFPTSEKEFDFKDKSNGQQSLRWVHLSKFNEESVTLPIDKVVANIIIQKYWYQ